MARLPRGVSEKDFQEALVQFERIVGKQWLFTSEEDVGLYRDAYSIFLGEPEDPWASAAVAPDTVPQVQAIMRVCNEKRIPVFPISTGKNLGYGGSAPNLAGSVILDLKRMNRILEVNTQNHSVLVEPGVSFFDLYRHLQERGLKLMLDVPETGWGSFIGNSLEHGVGYTTGDMRDHFGAHCGMEVVMPNGDLVRTGMGAMPAAKTWQEFRYGAGPYVDGLFGQSNYGVVTKMGVWVSPLPEAYRLHRISVPRRADLVPLIDEINFLENSGIVNGFVELTCPAFQGKFSVERNPELRALVSKPGGASNAELEKYAAKTGLPYFGATLEFYGPEKVIEAQWAYAWERLSKIPGTTATQELAYTLPLTQKQMDEADFLPSFGVPSLSAFDYGARSKYNPKPSQGHVWLSPVIPRNGEAVFKAQKVCMEVSRELGLDLHASPATMPHLMFKRSFVFLFGIQVSANPDENKKNRELLRKAIQIFASHGWGEYRTPPAFQDNVMATYSFNNHALLRLHQAIKDALDPNGILAAGRYGIWPKHLREETT